MKQVTTRKEKISLIKGLLGGTVSLKETLAPSIEIIYSTEVDASQFYREDGSLISKAEMQAIEHQAGRPVIWVNIVDPGMDKYLFTLPYNHRDEIPEGTTMHEGNLNETK